MANIIEKISKFVKSQCLFKPGSKIVVAVSGGPDSVAMLYALNALKSRFGIILHVAHYNHGIETSANHDAHFVQSLCDQWSLPISVQKGEIFKKKRSLEEAAREERFNFLCEVAKKTHAHIVSLGHTIDDQAETVLMRIIRGAGLLGLGGILPKRTINKKIFIRPLLCVTRQEILTFLKEKKLKYCTDPSNVQKKFFRNKIRMELMPILEKSYNSNIKKTLLHLSQTVSTDYNFLLNQANDAFKKNATFFISKKKISIKLKEFQRLDPSLQRMLLRIAIEKVQGNTRRLTLQHILEAENFINTKNTSNTLMCFPQKIKISKNIKSFFIQKVS